MAFAWISEVDFEDGTRGTFDSETDTDSKLDFPHYSDLARIPGMPAPWRGAYCMRIDLAGGTNDAYVEETGDWDMAAAENQFWRFMLWVDPKITMANNDEFEILRLVATATTEVVVVINFTTANGLRLGVGETAGTQFLPLSTGVWHAGELDVTLDAGGGNDGTLDLTLDGSPATQVTALDQGAITLGRLGAMGIDAGTTAGVILFDSVISDEAQIYQPARRFSDTVMLTKTGHAFVGPGIIDNVTLMSGNATNNVLSIFDTDVANINDAGNIVVELKNTASNNEVVDPAGMPVRIQRGAYVVLSGTEPRALVKLKTAVAWGSDGAIRSYGLRRKEAPGGI